MTNLVLTGTFPETKIRDKLSKFWDEQIGGDSVAGDAFSTGACMDSLTACLALLDVEEVLGVQDLPQTLVQRNGYDSKDDFIDHLTARVKEIFT